MDSRAGAVLSFAREPFPAVQILTQTARPGARTDVTCTIYYAGSRRALAIAVRNAHVEPRYTVDIDSLFDLQRAEWLVYNAGLDMVDPGKRRRSLPKEIKLIVFDFDGVMTDNRVWVDQDGREMVAANRSDGMGVSLLRSRLGIEMLVLSREPNPVVEARIQAPSKKHWLGFPLSPSLCRTATHIRPSASPAWTIGRTPSIYSTLRSRKSLPHCSQRADLFICVRVYLFTPNSSCFFLSSRLMARTASSNTSTGFAPCKTTRFQALSTWREVK